MHLDGGPEPPSHQGPLRWRAPFRKMAFALQEAAEGPFKVFAMPDEIPVRRSFASRPDSSRRARRGARRLTDESVPGEGVARLTRGLRG